MGAAIRGPKLNMDLFKKRELSGAVTSQALAVFGFYGALFLLTQFFQFSVGYSALRAGVCILPAAGALELVAPLSGGSLHRSGPGLTRGECRTEAFGQLPDMRRRGQYHHAGGIPWPATVRACVRHAFGNGGRQR